MLAVFLENGKVSVREIRAPCRKPGWALLRLRVAGICNTDLELQRGYYSFRGIPGHEFIGEVLEAEDGAWIGKRAAAEINFACGKCEWCLRGMGRHCPRRRVLGILKHPGAFREVIDVPVSNLVAVPDSIDDEEAVFIEPVAAACEILEQVRIPPGATVAVLGDGKLGLLAAQVLATHGAETHLFGRHSHKLRIAERAGVRVHKADRLPRYAYDWVVEATGSADGLNAAVAMTRPRGTVILKSTVHEMPRFDAAAAVVNEITITGSRCGRFVDALRVMRKGMLNLREMLTAEFPLCQAPAAFRKAAEPGALKVLLRPSTRA